MTDLPAGLDDLAIETPSWAYANSGTRFKVFAQKGVPRDPFEKIADAAQVHAFTGAAPTVALHIPWDKVSDYSLLAAYAVDRGVRLGAINANVFQSRKPPPRHCSWTPRRCGPRRTAVTCWPRTRC